MYLPRIMACIGLFSNVSHFMINKNLARPAPARALPSESLQASDAICAALQII
jgi:hypothetical protein